ncbi:MAG: hypothetical protein MUF23_17310, partial [Pirellula sp.]|nr:hypothetical protein [Pirellula sp.]
MSDKKFLRSLRARIRNSLRRISLLRLKREFAKWIEPPKKEKSYAIRPFHRTQASIWSRWSRPQHERLEERMLLASDLVYPTGASDLTLLFDASSAQYRLAQSADTEVIVSSLSASSIGTDGIRIIGTSSGDVLRLDMTSLSEVTAPIKLTMIGGGIDTLSVSSDSDFEFSDSTLFVDRTEFRPAGFEQWTLIGEASDNSFQFGALTSINVTIQGGDGDDTLLGNNGDNIWSLTASGTGSTSRVAFSEMENLVGGSGGDTYRFQDGASGLYRIDETNGGADTVHFGSRTSGVTFDASSTEEQDV